MKPWEANIAALRLSESGAFTEALDLAQDPSLRELLAFRARQIPSTSEPAILGWREYFRAAYRNAVSHFVNQTGSGWLKAWAELGIAKAASDCGFWKAALEWCAKAWLTASAGEHLDLLAEISGARGEILLRAGRPTRAAAAFSEDLAFLTPGSRYAGRVRCYLAHAWSRMGPEGQRAARLFYRLASHSQGEPDTRPFAVCGLALLETRVGGECRKDKIPQMSEPGLPAFWIKICQTKGEEPGSLREHLAAETEALLPAEYHAERWWLSGWLGRPDSSTLSALDIRDVLPVPPPTFTRVEMPDLETDIPDAPWWRPQEWPDSPEGWWKLRDHFMP